MNIFSYVSELFKGLDFFVYFERKGGGVLKIEALSKILAFLFPALTNGGALRRKRLGKVETCMGRPGPRAGQAGPGPKAKMSGRTRAGPS